MTRDGRSLDHQTLETIRTMAVTRVREGERPSVVIASYGFHRCTIYRWLKTTRGCGHNLTALASRLATGRPRTLTAAQERQVFRWINGKNTTQYGFDFELWLNSNKGTKSDIGFSVTWVCSRKRATIPTSPPPPLHFHPLANHLGKV